MRTLRLTTSEQDIERAGEIIRAGGRVAFPTETVYGLGADALNAEAVARIYAAKGRPSDNPMIVHIAAVSELEPLVRDGFDGISEEALDIMKAFWPGPLTLVFPKSDAVPKITTGGLDTVAIRMPSNETAQAFIAAADRPIAAPSANISGKPSPTTYTDVLEDMNDRIEAVIMGEQCDVGIESTVLDMTGEKPTILRPGIITAEWISAVTGIEVEYDKSLLEHHGDLADPGAGVADSEFAPKSPGMKYKHYAPKAKVVIVDCSEEDFASRVLALGTMAKSEGMKVGILHYDNDARKAAHKLFADLREMDRAGYDVILVKALEEEGLGFSVMNRMLKSAGYDVVK